MMHKSNDRKVNDSKEIARRDEESRLLAAASNYVQAEPTRAVAFSGAPVKIKNTATAKGFSAHGFNAATSSAFSSPKKHGASGSKIQVTPQDIKATSATAFSLSKLKFAAAVAGKSSANSATAVAQVVCKTPVGTFQLTGDTSKLTKLKFTAAAAHTPLVASAAVDNFGKQAGEIVVPARAPALNPPGGLQL